MTRKRVTKEEKEQRQQWAVAQIDKGVGVPQGYDPSQLRHMRHLDIKKGDGCSPAPPLFY